MIQWLADWWRFLTMAAALGAINFLSYQFLALPVAAGVTTFANFIGGGNMIFDLINRGAWQRRVQDLGEQIAERDKTIANQNRAIDDKDRTIDDKDRTIADRDREIAELRRQVEEGKNGNSAS